MNPPHMNPSPEQRMTWLRFFPPSSWLAAYRREWLPSDAIAGVTLAAYAIPVSLAYAALAGLPPQVGIYGYLLGGIGYALLGSSRQLAVGPTSAISLMIASTVGVLAGGDAVARELARRVGGPSVVRTGRCSGGRHGFHVLVQRQVALAP